MMPALKNLSRKKFKLTHYPRAACLAFAAAMLAYNVLALVARALARPGR